MTHPITASYENLMEDAQLSTKYYVHTGKRVIDEEFGAGYAAKNPVLMAAFLTTASHEMMAAHIKLAAQDIREGLTDAADTVASAIEAAGETVGTTLSEAIVEALTAGGGADDAIREIAEAITGALVGRDGGNVAEQLLEIGMAIRRPDEMRVRGGVGV